MLMACTQGVTAVRITGGFAAFRMSHEIGLHADASNHYAETEDANNMRP